jgi:hypothetical protein
MWKILRAWQPFQFIIRINLKIIFSLQKMKSGLILIWIGMLCCSSALHSQVVLDSTHLPIIFIRANWLQWIPDEPKIVVDMSILDNGYNATNLVTDLNYVYEGKIGIEQRGSVSQQWWWTQKSYGVETLTPDELDTNVVLLGMPQENDWVLYGPFTENTLMHNTLTYQLAREMGYWAPRTKYCEMMIEQGFDTEYIYNGIYVLTEKIKRDNNRVDIAKLNPGDISGDELTGGYIIAVDQNINTPDSGWYSTHPENANVFLTYKYPKGDEIVPEQMAYIQGYVNDFENALSGPDFADPVLGYRNYIEPQTFMDFFFMQEISKNVDAYKRSSYLYKDKNGKLNANPQWDYNSAWNIQLFGCEPFSADTGWTYDMTCWVNSGYPVPFWWSRLLEDATYANDLKCRWEDLRSTTLSNDHIFHIMDSIADYISDASVRHFTLYAMPGDLDSSVTALQSWIGNRMAWLDANMPGTCVPSGINEEVIENGFAIYPNPANQEITVSWRDAHLAQLSICNTLGQVVFQKRMSNGSGKIDISHLERGIYLVQLQSGERVLSTRLVVEAR